MSKLNDFILEENPNFYSLKKLIGQGIKDVEIYFEKKNGQVLVIAVNLILEDNKKLGLDADDYLTYLLDYNNDINNFDDDTLYKLYIEDEYNNQ